jgi:Recombination directionality factor-like
MEQSMRFTKIIGQDNPRNQKRLPRLGKIRLGIKIKSGAVEYPRETNYFVCPPEIQAVYGGEPKILPVMIPVEDEGLFLRQYYALYGSNQRLKCHGDGRTCE